MSCVGIACLVASVLDFGAVPNDGIDDTVALQAAFDAVAPGGTISFAPGQYEHGGQLYVRNAQHVEIDGRGALLLATHPVNAALTVQDSTDVTVRALRLEGSGVERSQSDRSCGLLVYRTEGLLVNALEVFGFAGAGIHLQTTSDFEVSANTVYDTLADAIHVTNRSHDGVVADNVTFGSGDDGVAFVGYVKNGGPIVNVEATGNAILGNEWGRGITVEGVQGALVENNYIESTSSAGIILSSSGSYNQYGVQDVIIRRNTIVGANYGTTTHGAILLSARDGSADGIPFNIRRVTIEDNAIIDTVGASAHLRVSPFTFDVVVQRNHFYDADSSHRAWTFYAGHGAANAGGNTYNGAHTNGGNP